MATVTITIQYAAQSGTEPIKLKLTLPKNKTLLAATKAFAKAVAKSKPELPAIAIEDVALTRADGTAVEATRAVGDACDDREAPASERIATPPRCASHGVALQSATLQKSTETVLAAPRPRTWRFGGVAAPPRPRAASVQRCKNDGKRSLCLRVRSRRGASRGQPPSFVSRGAAGSREVARGRRRGDVGGASRPRRGFATWIFRGGRIVGAQARR